ncbi:MAG: ppaX 1 [Planctomycetaceae bacterium]|nr:ppaX 1 [Planctomycetaceae bacterium]
MRPKAVLLDVDGTLIDSNDAHAHAWVDALLESNISVEFAVVRRLIGMGGDKLLPKVANIDAESRQGKAISQRRGEIFQSKYLPEIRPFPDVGVLLRRMEQENLILAVASSAKENELDSLLGLFDGKNFIQLTTSSDDVDNSKPDPDIIEVALGRLGHPREAVILLGDTPFDVEASLRAGIRAIALRCGGWSDIDLQGAVQIYDDPADLLIHFDKSPLCEL